jgi:hydroxymethylbilane synthase
MVPGIASLRLGTRGSQLALAQATRVQATLHAMHPSLDVEITVIKTSGDRGERERVGAFVREIQEALLENRIDLALHCLKDLPVDPVPGLDLAAYLEREDPRDTLISNVGRFEDLEPGSTIGTGSVRRSSQIAWIRKDLQFKPLVGNIDTRLRKLRDGEYDAIILAIAGLNRLGLMNHWADYAPLQVLPMDVGAMLPAPGQGVLVLETRAQDDPTHEAVASLEHHETRACATAERAFLQVFGGGCSMPIAALGENASGRLTLTGMVAAPDGAALAKGQAEGDLDAPLELAKVLAEQLASKGAREFLQAGGRIL